MKAYEYINEKSSLTSCGPFSQVTLLLVANFGGQNVLLHSCLKCCDKSERSDLLVGRMRCHTVVSSFMISQKDLTKGVIQLCNTLGEKQ